MTGTNRGNRSFDESILETAAEREAFGTGVHYARTYDLSTPAERAYLEGLADARRDILHRFVRGVLRGSPAGLPDPVFVPLSSSSPSSTTVPDTPEPLSALDWNRLQSILAPLPEECRQLALVALPASERVLIAPLAARHGYDRFRLVGPIRLWSASAAETDADADSSNTDDADADVKRLSHPIDLIPVLKREDAFTDADQADRIRAELAESVANLALARLASAVQADAVSETSESVSPLETITTGIPAADDAVAFERIVTDGHPFHPSAKIRRGMTPGDGLAYAPEFTDRIDLRFVAVDRAYALETRAGADDDTGADRDDHLTDRLFATFDGLAGALERALPSLCDADEYAVVPVHPMQFHRTIPERYADQRADGRVVPIPEYAHSATPQLNLRTVVPYETEATAAVDHPLPHLKLAIPVQTTNVVRTLSPHAVSNGPQVTAVVRTVADRESLETLGLLSEPAATCYYPPGGPHPDGDGFDDARHLSGLARTNPAAHPLASSGEYQVVASSLVADAPSTGRPLVCDLIDQFGPTVDAASTEDAALAFLEQYAAVVVPEQLRLLCAYGVALESHLQNSLVVFDEDARPTATLVRDLGGIRVLGDRLAERGLSIDPYPDSDLDADGEGDLHRKLYYALFQNHLAELVATIAHECGVDEHECWTVIREECERAFDHIRTDSRVPDARVDRDEDALFENPATHKALTAMRLRGKRHEYVTSEVANPLSAAGRRQIDP